MSVEHTADTCELLKAECEAEMANAGVDATVVVTYEHDGFCITCTRTSDDKRCGVSCGGRPTARRTTSDIARFAARMFTDWFKEYGNGEQP